MKVKQIPLTSTVQTIEFDTFVSPEVTNQAVFKHQSSTRSRPTSTSTAARFGRRLPRGHGPADLIGCSAAQFCTNVDGSDPQMGPVICEASDWMNDEPTMLAPGDCVYDFANLQCTEAATGSETVPPPFWALRRTLGVCPCAPSPP